VARVISVCHSCGRDDQVVVLVRRVYLTLPDWDREERVEVVDEVEQWCAVCREHYPHQLIEDADG
jgi:thymidine kinase